MNKTNLKRYAPEARKDFIATVTARAHLLGLSERAGKAHAEPCEVKGDVALIGGRPWPANVQGRREALLKRMQREGFAHTLEAVAYTWFNRLAALRYMELHDYLGHGRCVLSNPEGGLPEVLTHALALAESGELPGLPVAKVRDLKLANHDGELYRSVLIAQCNALHQTMPFLFEAIDDETELLLPDNLLLSDSIVAKLVDEIPEEDWTEVEVIGWLYQFYISEKKDEVIGKVVKSEDIPAATQLFTPNWIVQYLVQNSVGRLWLMANPDSTLAGQWPYYIQPAEQMPEVQAQLDALIQTRIREDGEALNPETITVLDPACGSGHILVVAYDVLKAIYLERGYQPRAIPRLILEKNVYGLDIDDRAAQLAAFALLMKARADDRRLFNDPPKLNVLSLQESMGLDADELATHLAPFGLQRAALKALLDTFEHAKTFGSLTQIPVGLNGQLAVMTAGLQQALQDGDLYARQGARDVLPLVWQALLLGMQFDAVVANPPYMGSKYYASTLKKLVEEKYKTGKGDLYTCFMIRCAKLCKVSGSAGMITIPNWMFLSVFRDLREWIFKNTTIETFCHNGRGVFGSDFGSCSFTFRHQPSPAYEGAYKKLFEKHGSVSSNEELDSRFAIAENFFVTANDFNKVPGSPVAYWLSKKKREVFSRSRSLGDVSVAAVGQNTGDNERFLRRWHEVSFDRVSFNTTERSQTFLDGRRWYPYNKGGEFRKWYGNLEYVVNWQNDADEIKRFAVERNGGKHWSRYIQNLDYILREGITWSDVTSGVLSGRYLPQGCISDVSGPAAFFDEIDFRIGLSILNSKFTQDIAKVLNPTIHFQCGNYRSIPYIDDHNRVEVEEIVSEAIYLSKADWDNHETSWGFSLPYWLASNGDGLTIGSSWNSWANHAASRINRLRELEVKNNLIFIESYALNGEVSPEVPESQITLARADREEDCQRLISYAIGCMMGRYSLDEPGLIYAHAGNVGFDPGRYEKKFPADADGIVPLTDERWFEDDAASRVREFLRALWGAETLEENMAWLAESLGIKGSETPDEAIRRYLDDKFFKDHLQTYKKRPIYWLFSSGRQGAFQALVYLHRYHEGTLARLRAEYVLPLTGKMQVRIESLAADVRAASSTASRSKLNKQLEALRKQQLELLAYDEKLRHYADMRISLDLDDGVKVNYGKFGDLLAEVKAVTGGTSDD